MHGGLLSLDRFQIRTTLGDNDIAWRYIKLYPVEARYKSSWLRFGQAQPNPGTRRAGNLIGQDTGLVDLRSGPFKSFRSTTQRWNRPTSSGRRALRRPPSASPRRPGSIPTPPRPAPARPAGPGPAAPAAASPGATAASSRGRSGTSASAPPPPAPGPSGRRRRPVGRSSAWRRPRLLQLPPPPSPPQAGHPPGLPLATPPAGRSQPPPPAPQLQRAPSHRRTACGSSSTASSSPPRRRCPQRLVPVPTRHSDRRHPTRRTALPVCLPLLPAKSNSTRTPPCPTGPRWWST